MADEARRHHLVPRWYLKRFATQKGKIGVIDMGAQKRYVSTVRTAGAEVGFYDVEVEGVRRDAVEQLLGRVESPASGATAKLSTNGPHALSAKEKFEAALFLATQFLRGADRRDFANSIADALVKAQFVGSTDAALREEFERVKGEGSSATDFENWRDFVRDPARYKVTQTSVVPQLLLEHAVPYANFLTFEYSWTVERFSVPALVTCDVPVGLWRDRGEQPWLGVGMATADEVRVPLDPSHALVLRSLRAPAAAPPEGLYRGTAETFEAVMESVLGWAYRWVFMHPDHPLFMSLKTPSMREQAEGARDLIDMARKMRLAHDTGTKSGRTRRASDS